MSWFPVGLTGAFQVTPLSVLRTMVPAAPTATAVVRETKVTSRRFWLGSAVTDWRVQVVPLSVLRKMKETLPPPPVLFPTARTVAPLEAMAFSGTVGLGVGRTSQVAPLFEL